MIDWDSVAQEAAQLLSVYLRIRSLNPPGDEREAAAFLAARLGERGFETQIYESGENRVNLTARLRGDGSRRPIVLYHHMDVVDADPTRWTTDPFSGEIRDGYVWGRGAIDMKGMGIMQLLALTLLAQHQPQRSRDIIFLAAADEEKGGLLGARWMIENHWEEMNPEYVWDEGGFGLEDLFGPFPVFTVAVAQKIDLWVRLTACGEPGHSGMPHGGNAANRLLKAVEKVLSLNEQMRVHPVVKGMFAGLAAKMPFPQSLLLRHLDHPLAFRMVKPRLAANPTLAAMLKDTVSLTVLRAGGKGNIIPERAEATFDIRLLPDRDPQAFVEKLKAMIADEHVQVEMLHAPELSQPSPVDSEFFRTLRAVLSEHVPQGVTVPMLTPGTTDSGFFRARGVQCYGLFPAVISPDELARFHGIDERLSVANLRLGTQVIYDVLRRMI